MQTASVNLGPALFFDDNKFLRNMVNGIENDPDISFIYVTDHLNQMKYGYRYSQNMELIKSFLGSNKVQEFSDNMLILKQSIFFQDEYRGALVVGMSLAWVHKKVAIQTRNLVLISMGLALILIFISSIIARTISKPLQDAVGAIKLYSDKEGVLELRLPVKGTDEVAQLSTALNQLADNLDSNLRELNKSKKYQETLFQLSPIPIIIADTLGQIEEVNESASGFFGVERTVLVQMNLDRFFQTEDLNAIFNRIIQDMQNVRGYVTTLRMTDGNKKIVELNIESHQDDMNYVKNVIIAIIDITEKIHIQREILQNQTKLQRINDELRLKTEELERLSSWNTKNAHNLAQLITVSQQMMRAMTPNLILQKIIEDGRALLDADECVIYLWDSKTDKLVQSIVSSEEVKKRISPFVQNDDNFIWRTYQDNDPFVCDSDELEIHEIKLLGLNREDVFSLVSVPISEKDYRFGVILFLKRDNHAFRVEDVHLLSTLANQAAILLDNIHLVHAFKEKAASLEKAYEDLQKSQQQVIQLQKMESLGTLVGGIAHDFNNILGIIIPNTDLLRNDAQGNGSVLRRVNIISEAAQRAADLTRQLLMFSRNQDIQVKMLSPNQLISRLSSMFKRTLGKEYDILLDLDPDVQDVEADETRLTQVLVNLGVNARDAMKDGGQITIRTRMARYKPKMANNSVEKEYVCISIADTGVGIKGADFDKIFDPFFTTKSVGKGTGLGLSVVYGIMQSHKGFVDVESKVGKGTTFFLYFPPVPKRELQAEEVKTKAIPKGNENILVIDDENMIRDSIKEILESFGYSVVTASGGMEGLKIIQENRRHFDLAIVDMSMPKMNGVETIRNIRQLDSSIKVLLSSGHLDRDRIVPPDLNVDGTLPKPYRMRELALKVRQVLAPKVEQVVSLSSLQQ